MSERRPFGWRPRFELLALLPLLWAAARAWWTDWLPLGENALMSLRARDVLTGNHPWLGTASSGSLTAGTAVNHPGPLAFDLFAPPVRLFGSASGLIIGALVLHGLAVLVAGHVARRAGGERLVVITTFAFLCLQWSLGPNLVLDPWNPHLVLLPFLAFLTCAAASASGVSSSLPWAMGFGSLVLQTHVSYVLLVPLIGAGAVAALWWRTRGAPTPRRSWIAAAVVLTACWAQPFWQQLFGPGEGNLGQLLLSGRGGSRVGGGLAVRLAAEVLVLPPTWARPSFEKSISDMPVLDATGTRLPSPSWLIGPIVASIGLVVLVAALVWLIVRCRRNGATAASAWLSVGVAGVVLSVATVAFVPAAGYGIAPHQVRWLWPIAIWWMAAVVFAVVELRPDVVAMLRRVRWLPWGVAGLMVVACLPPYDVPVGVARAPGSKESVAALVDQLAGVQIPPARFDPSGMWIGEPYSVPVIEAFLAAGQPVRVGEDAGAQFGARRVAGADVQATMWLRHGAEALACGAGRTLALVTPLTDVEVARYRELQREVYDTLASVSIDPTNLADALAAGAAPQLLADAGFADGSPEASEGAVFEAFRLDLDIETVALLLVDPDQPAAQGCD